MSRYFIMHVDGLIKMFDIIESGKELLFSLSAQGKPELFRVVDKGDFILGYCGEPLENVKYLFEVISSENSGKIRLKKLLDSSFGAEININLADSTVKNEICEIDHQVFNEICSRLFHKLNNYFPSESGCDNKNCRIDLPNERFRINYDNLYVNHNYESRNIIYFGAPGTGKSYMLNQDKNDLIGYDNNADFERVTFHPDYSYANFVGTYKPIPYIDENGKKCITYKYVPGPFMRLLVKALKNSMEDNEKIKPFVLIIEEINRANTSAVFGDVFQLLDRDSNGLSEYSVSLSEDIKKYLSCEFSCGTEDIDSLRIPSNMYIWATMNSADQGVFPMDTAFKRRWDFKYLGIDEGMDKVIDDQNMIKMIDVKFTAAEQEYFWNDLRRAINQRMADLKINEDKMLGPFFISSRILIHGSNHDFINAFKSKVIMYLYEDAARQRREKMFSGYFMNENARHSYSDICKAFDEIGIDIFGFSNNEISAIKTLTPNPNGEIL